MSKRTLLAGALALGGCGSPAPAVPHEDAAPIADAAPPDADAPSDPITLELSGAFAPVHDPVIVNVDGAYLLFSTGAGIERRISFDLVNWSLAGQVFASKPPWITTTDPAQQNQLWAPDVSVFGGTYHLYYSASRFGSNVSCIGHATTTAPLDNAWTDHGPVICSQASDTWNAIDPNVVLDTAGKPWLAFGSFWSGLKLIPLAADGSREGDELIALSAREDSAVEAPFVVPHGGYYYLFESVGACCQGIASTYKVLVGRSTDVRGPYVDAAGAPLLAGGGTLVVDADARWRGPGHNAILRTAAGDYNVYHSYDANAGGTPTLRISQLRWADGWPTSAGP